MVHIKATRKVRDQLGIGKLALAPAGRTESWLGNWLVNMVPMAGRYAFLYASSRSLLSFPLLIGKQRPELADMPTFLAHGVGQLLPPLGISADKVAMLIADFETVALCKATDRSELALHAAIAADYRDLADRAGRNLDIGAIIHEVNSFPRASLGWRSAFNVTCDLAVVNEA